MSNFVASASPLRVLAIDPSTVCTGVALVDFFSPARARVVYLGEIGAPSKGRDTFTARIRRIHAQACQFRPPLDVDGASEPLLVAVEKGFHRGGDSDALPMAVGALLSQLSPSQVERAEFVEVTRQAACTAAGCLSLYRAPRGKTSAEQEAKRSELKRAVIVWASRAYGLKLAGNEDAKADALALAQAAYDAQCLKGKRSAR